ncbi:MAG TPA: ABC transporter ATP-binding protein [Thermotogota bacterium]|nr:ABC transporter ATP-binding protein [Thermotogota bacterium]NLH19220.1 ABC transporter ATP-binding protein [Thermotogaceae bacterium]OQC32953.1 MAG: Lipid A export ATP-binding/permease protein MsbA [Thermotogota bacterium ADurb.Bin062]HNW47702.1 ABC transporter ATP-binding protein [Thermotogota bacterium]HNY81623.1 ABC transporter ATP-binding protein [Thermotogota bacterium]
MKNVFLYFKPYRWWALLSISLVVTRAMTELYLPNLMSKIVDRGIATGNIELILRTGLAMLGVTAITFVVIFCTSFLSSQISARFARDLRKGIFEKVETFSLEDVESFGIASLITRTTNDVSQIQQALMMSLRMVVMAPVMAVGSVIMAFWKNARLSSILFVSIPFLLFGVYFITRKAIPFFRAMQDKVDRLNQVLRENLTGIRVIRAFGKSDYEKRRFVETNEDLTTTSLRVHRIVALVTPVIMLVMNVTILALLVFGSFQIDTGTLQIGELMAIIQYVLHITNAFIMMSMVFSFLPRAEVSIRRIEEVLSRPASIENSEEAVPLPYQPGATVTFEEVTFRYPGASEPALNHISFTAESGKTTAIIGSTASGKTTLLNLLMRFYEVDQGSIMINGVDIKKAKLEDIRGKIGYATQKAVVFTGSVKENIRFGREEITDAQVERAMRIAQLEPFVNAMPQKADTVIAQGGTDLSGGQRQRLSIARAIAADPPILLFDDTFSALDFKTDAKLRLALRAEMRNKTLLIIAQRVSTIMDADQILVLKNGVLAGKGSHAQLMRDCPEYREIVYSQLSEEEIA